MRVLVVDDVKGWRDYNSQIVNELFNNQVKIKEADSATTAYNLVIENVASPYDIIITDLQMELDYEPKFAGEWLVEQIKMLKSYSKTKIIIISASYNVRNIAENLKVQCIPKSTALKSFSIYQELILGSIEK